LEHRWGAAALHSCHLDRESTIANDGLRSGETLCSPPATTPLIEPRGHDAGTTSSDPQPKVRDALLGQRYFLEDCGRSFAERGLGADPHPNRCRIVIAEQADELPGLLVEGVIEPDCFRIRRNLHVDTLRSDYVMIVVVRGSNSAD